MKFTASQCGPSMMLIMSLLTTLSLGAETVTKPGKRASMSTEISTDLGYVGGAKAHSGNHPYGKIDEINNSFKALVSKNITDDIALRMGVNWERYSFTLPIGVPLPNTLQSVSLPLGMDFKISNEWMVRVQTNPGIYSDFADISFDDVNSPSLIGASYKMNDNVLWFFGLTVDARRDIPVLPGAGVRWKFADKWTANLIFPKPRLQYDLTKTLMLWAGGELKGGTYSVAEDFGNQFGRPNLNGQRLTYSEGRIGLGAALKLHPVVTLELEGGAMVYRKWDFHEPTVSISSTQPAAYGQVGLRANF